MTGYCPLSPLTVLADAEMTGVMPSQLEYDGLVLLDAALLYRPPVAETPAVTQKVERPRFD